MVFLCFKLFFGKESSSYSKKPVHGAGKMVEVIGRINPGPTSDVCFVRKRTLNNKFLLY